MNYYILLISIIILVCLAFSYHPLREHFWSCLGCPINSFELDPKPQKIIYADQTQQFLNKCETFVSQNSTKLGFNQRIPKKVWIYYPYQKNSRHWWDYGSRLHYQQNSGLFHTSLQNLRRKLPGYDVVVLDQTNIEELTNIPVGLLENEMLIQATIMYKYGGIWLSAYSYPIRSIDWMLDEKCLVCFVSYEWNKPSPSASLPGQKLWRDMIYYIAYNPLTYSDYSDFNKFWYFVNCNRKDLRLIDGRIFGLLDRQGRDITFINLTSQADTKLDPECCVVCIDKSEELRRDTQWIILYDCKSLLENSETLWLKTLLK